MNGTPGSAVTSENGVQLRFVREPDDPSLAGLADLLLETFADPDIVLGLDRMQEFLAGDNHPPARTFHVLVAEHDGQVVGGSVFSYVPASNLGFSEYIVASRQHRATGVGGALFRGRREALHADAQAAGFAACDGFFVETDDPLRAPAEMMEAERETAMDAWERLAYFKHLGFRRVAIPYVQLPLGPGKSAVPYLDLLFCPWETRIASARRLSAAALLTTVQAIWSRWAPGSYAAEFEALTRAASIPDVHLSEIQLPGQTTPPTGQ